MATTVYLVWQGSYSDRRVEGVFSTRDGAEDFLISADMIRGDEAVDVEEWAVDELVGARPVTLHRVGINLDSGELAPWGAQTVLIVPRIGCFIDGPKERGGTIKAPWLHVSSPVSREHAVKVAVEKRQEWLRARAAAGQAGGGGAASAATAPA
jgi:hypothetical protein